MTENKPIIVYGIDVSECLLFDKRKGICFKNKKSCSAICSYATYKLREQLYYKTQECEELKEKLEKQKDYIINYKLFSMDKYDQLKAENEKLKKDRINIIKENSKDYRKLQQAEQKLKRIKEIASKVLLNTHNLEQFKDADALFSSLLEIYKISEVQDAKTN